jgi:hypothetical protein
MAGDIAGRVWSGELQVGCSDLGPAAAVQSLKSAGLRSRRRGCEPKETFLDSQNGCVLG